MVDLYVDSAVERLRGLVIEAGALLTPPITAVSDGADPRYALPYWWLIPGGDVSEPLTSQSVDKQTWTIVIRLVMGYSTQGYDTKTANMVSRLWVVIPTVKNYLKRNKRLLRVNDTEPPQYLNPASMLSVGPTSPFGAFSGQDHLGVEFSVTIGFMVPITGVK